MAIDIKPNGDAHVRERITYDFNGDYNGILRDIDFDATDGIEGIAVYLSLIHISWWWRSGIRPCGGC